MRRAGILLAAAAALLLPSAGMAQPAPPGTPLPLEHTFFVEGAALDLYETVDTRSMVALESEVGCTGPQDGDIVTFADDGRSFTFAEGQGVTGCIAVTYNITFPAPVDKVTVNFTADRTVTNEPSGSTIGTIGGVTGGNTNASIVQELRLRFPDGSVRSESYFSDEEGTAPPKLVESTFALPANSSFLELSWYFEDEGLGGLAVGGDPGQAQMAATVRDITLTAAGLPLPAPSTAASPETRSDATTPPQGTVLYWVNVTVPPDAVRLGGEGDSARSSDLVLEVRRGPALLERSGPAGPVSNQTFEARREGDAIFYVIDATDVAAQGAGPYSFRFSTTRQLAAVETPAPTTIEPFYYTLILLPAPAALLALFSSVQYKREAEGRYRRAATGILVVVAVAIVYYVVLLFYSIFGAGRDVMSTLPLNPEATLVYVQFIVLLLFFVAFAVVVGRYLVRGMRRDLEARRVQEEKLRRSNEELERFAYVASHDLQEPLRKVAGFTSLLQRRYKGRLDKDADEMIQYAVDGATRMQALIRDILAYSRVGSAELDVGPVEIAAVMELVAADLSEKIKEEKAQVTWDGLPTVPADAGQLRQVLQNLVENALKYRDPKRKPKVAVSAQRVGPDWRFAVADNGVGIPDDKLTDIFGIFRRLHGAEVPGTGIGLALAKKAVERHGGAIWVESKVGRGSTFYFTIPAREERSAPRWLAQARLSTGAANAPVGAAGDGQPTGR